MLLLRLNPRLDLWSSQRRSSSRLFCHVERSRDISYCSSANNQRFLDCARNDKESFLARQISFVVAAFAARSQAPQKTIMNKSKALFVLVPLVMPLANLRATPQDDQFQRIAHDYIEGFLTSNPENATELGDHRFDDKLTDYSAETRAQELARARQTRQQLEAFNELSQLTGANRVDIR